MQSSDVKHLIQSQLSDCRVLTNGEGCNFQITVVGDIFAKLTPLKRQQLVYDCLHEKITDGSIHAVSIKTYTTQQWNELNQ